MTNSTVQEIRMRLKEYLNYMGIKVDSSGYAPCPIHQDKKTKSFTIAGPNGHNMWKCFGCNNGGDIFTLANLLEGLPARGPEFMTVTVPTLAERFGVPIKNTTRALSDEEYTRKIVMEIYRFVKSHLIIDETVESFAKARDLDIALFKRLGIGRIKSYRGLVSKLRKQFKDEHLKVSKVFFQDLFTDRILFTLHDEKGQPVGFGGRYVGKDSDAKKYINSFNHPLYNKSEYLYNVHLTKKDEPLYVVEGYTDVLRLIQNGITNVVAICGTAVTDYHIQVLSQYDKVILSLDGDNAGKQKMDKVRRKLNNCVSILIPDSMDPDEYIRNFGIDYYRKLEHLDELSWDIIMHPFHQPKQDVMSFLYRISDSLPHLHHDYLVKLAKSSGIAYVELKQSLDAIIHKNSWRLLESMIAEKHKLGPVYLNVTIGGTPGGIKD